MDERSLLLDVMIEGAVGEVYVNDIPVGRVGRLGGNVFPVDHVIVKGRNAFEVLLNPGSTPSTARLGSQTDDIHETRVTLVAAHCPPGIAPGEPGSEPLFRFAWPDEGVANSAPRSVIHHYSFDRTKGPWKWESADVLSLDRSTVEAIQHYLVEFRDTLVRHDFEAFWHRNEVTHQEVSRAFAVPLSARRSAAELALKGRFMSSVFSMAPLDLSELDLRLVANRRLVECVSKDWGAAVRAVPDEQGKIMRFPIFLGRTGGRLQGLR